MRGEVCGDMRRAIAANARLFASEPQAIELDWGDASHLEGAAAAAGPRGRYALVLVSDCTYFPGSVRQLTRVIERLLLPHGLSAMRERDA